MYKLADYYVFEGCKKLGNVYLPKVEKVYFNKSLTTIVVRDFFIVHFCTMVSAIIISSKRDMKFEGRQNYDY